MKTRVMLCVAAAASIAAATPTLAGHSGGGMMGGSVGVGAGTSVSGPHGLSSGSNTNSTVRDSNGTTVNSDSSLSANTRAANVLGNLNAAHASSMALQHASSNSMVGAVATYKTSMTNALSLTNTTDQTNAIIAARQQLATRSNKQLTPAAITRVDSLIGINGADPTLGTTP
jgi:hypothetical protein